MRRSKPNRQELRVASICLGCKWFGIDSKRTPFCALEHDLGSKDCGSYAPVEVR